MALRESIVAAAALADPAPLADFYCERMPRMLAEQLGGGDDPARRLLWMEIDPERAPRLRAALAGLAGALARAGLRPADFRLPAMPAAAARIAAGTLLGSGLPLLGAYPFERDLVARELADGEDPHRVFDLRISGNLVHEICHGPRGARSDASAPWLILEAAAVHLGTAAFPQHVFPETAGEAIPGVSQYVLVGRALARFFGDRAVWSLALGAPIESAFGPVAGRVLAIAGWQEWMRRREPPFTRDASEAFAWVKLADAARGPSPLSAQIARAVSLDPLRGARELPDLLAAADAIPWRELPWWREAPSAADATLLRQAVAAMFHVDVLLATFQTHPLTPAALHLDAEACVISRDRDPRGAGPGEPPRWIAPPPLCRRLRERGCSRLSVGSAARGQLLSQILEDVPWMCSPS